MFINDRNRKSIKKKNFIIGKGKKYSFSYNFFLLKDKPIEELNILFFCHFFPAISILYPMYAYCNIFILQENNNQVNPYVIHPYLRVYFQ